MYIYNTKRFYNTVNLVGPLPAMSVDGTNK